MSAAVRGRLLVFTSAAGPQVRRYYMLNVANGRPCFYNAKGYVRFNERMGACPFRKSYPRVAMMQSTQDGHSNDGTRALDCSMQWRILVQ